MNVDTPSRISLVFTRNPLPATDSFQDALTLFGISVTVQFLTALPLLFHLLNPDGNFLSATPSNFSLIFQVPHVLRLKCRFSSPLLRFVVRPSSGVVLVIGVKLRKILRNFLQMFPPLFSARQTTQELPEFLSRLLHHSSISPFPLEGVHLL